MPRRTFITGLGLASPLGGTLDSTWQSLLAGRFITHHATVPQIAGDGGLRINRLAMQVAEEALSASRWSSQQRKSAGLVVGTSKGPVEAWLASSDRCEKPNPPAGHAWHSFGMSETASCLAQALRFSDGPRLTLSAACASGLHALIRAAMLIVDGQADRVLVIAAESSLHPLFIQSFHRLGVLPPEGVGCRPFDLHRAGFLMSEAAAAVCLEASDISDPDAPRETFAAVERFALSGDAFHLTGGDPTGQTLRRLLSHVIDQRSVDLVHAHGTGTEFNDPVELAAIEASIPDGDRPSSLYSHKGALGHSLGAAGLVSVAINCMIHREGIVPPNVRTQAPLPAGRVSIENAPRRRSVRRSLALAAGFGGSMAAVSLVGL
jgi:3-oxoacyl-[acyl-carrier-protein] synthase II